MLNRPGFLGVALVFLFNVLCNAATPKFISVPDRVDMVHDAAKNYLYITASSRVLTYDLNIEGFRLPFETSGSLRGIDISPDGNFLAAADATSTSSGNWFYLIDLRDSSVTKVTVNGATGAGTFAVAFAFDGTVLISSDFAGSGWVNLKRYDPATKGVTDCGSIRQSSMLSASGDRRYIGVAEANISSGPVRLFDVAKGQLEAGTGDDWFNYEIAVNKDGTQLATPTYGGMFVYDRNYQLVAKIGVYAGISPIGLAFHPTKDAIFTAWAGTSDIRVLNTTSFEELARFSLPSTQGFNHPGNTSFQPGRMKLSRDGSKVFVSVAGGISWFEHGLTNLPTFYKVVARGNPLNISQPLPYGYGTNYIEAGRTVTNEVSKTADLDGTRYQFIGADVSGVKRVDSGTVSNQVVFEVTTNGTVQWNWTPTAHLLTVGTIGGGSVSVTNEWVTHLNTISISATPGENYKFVRWIGQLPDALSETNPLTLTIDQARQIDAVFSDVSSSSGLVGEWPTFGRDPQHSGYFRGVLGKDRFANRWTAHFTNGINQVAVGGGRVFLTPKVYFNDGYLAALNETSGQLLWQRVFPPQPFSMNPPTFADGAVYFQRGNHGGDTQLYKLDAATGTNIWRAPLSAQWERYFAPVVADGRVWDVGGYYGGLYGHDARTGQQLFFTPGEQYDEWTPAYWNGRLFSFVAGKFRELDPGTGGTLWSVDLGWNWSGWSMNRSIAIVDGRAFVVNNPDLAAFDLLTKKLLWRVSGYFIGTPAASKGVVYVNEAGTNIVALSASGGERLGNYATSLTMNQPIVTDDVLISSDGEATYIFDLVKKTLVQTIPAGGEVSLANGSLFIATGAGSVEAWTTSKDAQLLVNSDGLEIGNPTPYPYGMNNVPQGARITNSVLPLVELNGTRYVANGFNLIGVEGSGGSNSVTFAMTNAAKLTWKWKVSEQQLLVYVSGKGTVSVSNAWFARGSQVALTASPAAGMRFVQWSGILPDEQRTNTSITLTMDQPRRLTAVFLPESSENWGGDWPTLGFETGHSSHLPVMIGTNKFHWRWSQALGSGLQQVAIGQNRVFGALSTPASSLRAAAWSEFSGQPLWSADLGSGNVLSPVSYWQGSVFLQKDNYGQSMTYRLNAADGTKVWASPYGAQWEQRRAPVVSDGYVFIQGGTYGGMYGYKAQDGAQLFFQTLEQQDRWTPAYFQGRLFSLVYGNFREHNPTNGQEIWKLPVSPQGSTVTPVVAEGKAFAVVGSGSFAAIDIDSRKIAWTSAGQFRGMPAVANGIVYIRDGGSLARFSAATGDRFADILLNVSGDDSPQQPIVTDDAVIVPAGNTTQIFDLGTDALRQVIPVGGALSLAGGVLYITEASGNLQSWSLYPENILTVRSAGAQVGRPYPFTYGSNYVPIGKDYEATAVPDNPAGQFTRTMPIGWTGTGDVPATGAGAVARFHFTQESSITWNWSTQNLVRVFVEGEGTVSATNAWVDSGETFKVTAAPGRYYLFDGWKGAVTNSALELTLKVDKPLDIYARFVPQMLTNGTPAWWLALNNLGVTDAGALADIDADGLPNWREYAEQLDPRNPDTDGDSYQDGLELSWRSDPHARTSFPTATLSISAVGSPGTISPIGYGSHQLPLSSINNIEAVAGLPRAGTRTAAVGWEGTGSVPTSGTGNAVSFVLGTNSTLKWLWQTQYVVTIKTNYVLQDGTTNKRPVASFSTRNARPESRFGSSVSICGSWAAVGAPFDQTPPTGALNGSVSLYQLTNGAWKFFSSLYPASQSATAFGGTVALGRTNLAVASLMGSQASVTLYVLRTNEWQYDAVVVPLVSPEFYDEMSLALTDTELFIGIPSFVLSGSPTGIVIVYQRTLAGYWVKKSEWYSQPLRAREQFGAALAVDGNRLVVGAPATREANGMETGGAYLIRFNPENLSTNSTVKINPVGVGNLARFGESVAIAGSDALIGAPEDSGGGSAFLYNQDQNKGVNLRARVRSPNRQVLERFGASVALTTGFAVVGAPQADSAVDFGGAVHVFSTSSGLWAGQVRSGSPQIDGLFGYSVAAKDGQVIVGGPGEATNAGSIHLFKVGQVMTSQEASAWVTANTNFSAPLAPGNATVGEQDYLFAGWTWNAQLLAGANGELFNPAPSTNLVGPVELVANYNGVAPELKLEINISRISEGNSMMFEVRCEPGRRYVIESSSALESNSWTNYLEILSTNRIHRIEKNSGEFPDRARFYRIREGAN